MALVKCSKCGHEISEKAIVCPKCGASIQKEAKDKNESSKGGKKKSLVAVLICALVIALIGLLAYVFTPNGDSEPQSTERSAEEAENETVSVRFADVFVNRMNTEESHINPKLHEYLQEQGYKLLKQKTTSEYYEVFESTLSQEHYYLGLNMEYDNENWHSLGTPCYGVEVVIGEPDSYVIVKFQDEEELNEFICDAEKSGFTYRHDDTWSRDSDYPYDCISKMDATTLRCSSSMPV